MIDAIAPWSACFVTGRPVLCETIAPIRLIDSAASASSSTGGTDAFAGLLPWALVALALAGSIIALSIVRTRLLPDEERAFRALAWRMKLGPSSRRALRHAAASLGMPPVALLLSPSTLSRAIDRSAPSVDRLSLERLAGRLPGPSKRP